MHVLLLDTKKNLILYWLLLWLYVLLEPCGWWLDMFDKDDPNGIENWEDYDPSLTLSENYIELQIYMGFLDDAKRVLYNISQQR